MSNPFSNQTEAAKAGLNLTLKPVEQFVTEGLQQRIFEALNVRTAWLTSDDKAAVLQRVFGNQNQGPTDKTLQYPYGFLTLQSTRVTEEIGNVHALAVRGLVAVFDGADTKAYRVRLMPTEFSIKFEYVHNDYRKILAFATTLLHAYRGGWLKFNIAYGRITLAASVTLEPNVSIPTKESRAGDNHEYTLEATIIVRSYSSIPTLIEQQVATQVELEANVDDSQGNSQNFWRWDQKSSQANDSVLAPGVVSRSI